MIPTLAFLLLLVNPASAGDGNLPKTAPSTATGGAQNADKLSTAKEYFTRGFKEDNNKDYEHAIRDYTEAIRLNPHYGEAFGNRGAMRFNMKDYRGALDDYNDALAIFPNHKGLLGLKAQAEQALRENAKSAAQNELSRRALNQARIQALLGGDLSDGSAIIMMNAQRRGLVAPDPGDPATIIMNSARRSGLVPANTPNP